MKTKRHSPANLSMEEIVEIMHDKQLSYINEVVTVIYSKDRSIRYVVLKDSNGLFSYQLESIYRYDDEEWVYFSTRETALPATWEPFRGFSSKSIFESLDELLNELRSEPEYKLYFE